MLWQLYLLREDLLIGFATHSCICNNWHSSLWRNSAHNCFNPATLEGFQAWMTRLRSCNSISIGFNLILRLCLSHSKELFCFYFKQLRSGLLGVFWAIVLLLNQVQIYREKAVTTAPCCRNLGKGGVLRWPVVIVLLEKCWPFLRFAAALKSISSQIHVNYFDLFFTSQNCCVAF